MYTTQDSQWKASTASALSAATGVDAFGVSETVNLVTGEEARFPPIAHDRPAGLRAHSSRATGKGRIDEVLLRKAQELVIAVDSSDLLAGQASLSALGGILFELWTSADRCSEMHQDILATVESAAKQANHEGLLTQEQQAFLVEALGYLGQHDLVCAKVDVVQSDYVDVGFAPLPFLD